MHVLFGSAFFLFFFQFPLLSKSNRLQKLLCKANEENSDEIQLADFPGGPTSFEMCAKFCYGITVTLSPYNVVAARCASEYLEMTEDLERGNLILKIEIFLNSGVLLSWKDSIIVLQTAKSLLPWSENLKIVMRCVDSIASKTSVDPSTVDWSYSYNRKLSTSDQIIEKLSGKPVARDWWVEDICELDIDLYKRVMSAIKSNCRTDGGVIGEALRAYVVRWLPDSADELLSEAHISRNKSLVETIIRLLPSDKGISCACSFLLKLLRVAILVGADDLSKEDLITSIGSRLDEASVGDLLIPARAHQNTVYDVELVRRLVDLKIADRNGKNDGDLVLGNGPWLQVGRVVDRYLAAVAGDVNLPVSCFVKLAESVPESARPVHDGLYGAIDIYLKEHKNLTKSERKNLCGLMDVKKLTRDTSMHAAQNEKLPLRVVVQVLFLEQAKASANKLHAPDTADTPTNTRENWTKMTPDNRKSLTKQMDETKMKEDEESLNNGKLVRKGSMNRGSGSRLLPSRSRKIFDKLWIVGKGIGSGENKSSETSASSQSPTSMVQGEIKPSDSSSRRRRHSIS
ncbi:hypothetical protein OROGR_005852 [Orobanche gracilis]